MVTWCHTEVSIGGVVMVMEWWLLVAPPTL